jgi:hypothetical protein
MAPSACSGPRVRVERGESNKERHGDPESSIDSVRSKPINDKRANDLALLRCNQPLQTSVRGLPVRLAYQARCK